MLKNLQNGVSMGNYIPQIIEESFVLRLCSRFILQWFVIEHELVMKYYI